MDRSVAHRETPKGPERERRDPVRHALQLPSFLLRPVWVEGPWATAGAWEEGWRHGAGVCGGPAVRARVSRVLGGPGEEASEGQPRVQSEAPLTQPAGLLFSRRDRA